MPYGRRFRLPIDPWPRSSLGERLSVAFVLALLLALPFFAAGVIALVLGLVIVHVYRSYDLGTSLRRLIDRPPAAKPLSPAALVPRAGGIQPR